jgi:hypothetical protein
LVVKFLKFILTQSVGQLQSHILTVQDDSLFIAALFSLGLFPFVSNSK